MALSQGTNGTSYSYTPPKPPKPQVSYGAPSGPYAGPISTSNGVPIYRDPNDLYQARGGGFATPENNLANRYMSGVMGGVLGMFNPYSYTSMPASLNYARKHPGEALHQMFGTAEGWGGLTAGALTAAVPAPKGLSALKNMRAARELEAAPAIPEGVQWAPGARAAIDAHFGPEMSAATRASMLKQAPSMAEILAEKTAMMEKVAPSRTLGRPGGGSVQSKSVFGHDPMEGRFFRYTGHDRMIDPDRHMQEIIDRFGSDSSTFHDAYDDFLNDPSDPGHPEPPPFVHNVKDPHGNVMGSLSWDETPPQIGVFGKSVSKPGIIHDPEVYMRPEARQSGQSARYFRDLIQPLLDRGKHTPISVSLANDRLRDPLLRRWRRGDIRLTEDTVARALTPDPDYPGFPNEKGMYPYEIPQELLPPLMQALTPRFGQFPPTIGATANSAVTRGPRRPFLRGWGQANTGGFPRNRPFYYGGL